MLYKPVDADDSDNYDQWIGSKNVSAKQFDINLKLLLGLFWGLLNKIFSLFVMTHLWKRMVSGLISSVIV